MLKDGKKLKNILIVSIIIIILFSIGISFARYMKDFAGNSNNKLVAGDIYMRYKESNQLILENAYPRDTYIENEYFEFQIVGKNKSSKNIIYDVVLNRGDSQASPKVRLDDKFLMFRLVEVVNNEETEIFTNKSYNSIVNTRIHVASIPGNTSSEITKTYRLYTWISRSVRIGNVEQNYTESEWVNVYASVKVNVTGDFEDKEIYQPGLFDTIVEKVSNVDYIASYDDLISQNSTFKTQDNYLDSYSKQTVYYYTGSNAAANSNVLFAGYCWQIIRTTDTGGIKVIYNGVAVNNKCETTRSEMTFKGIIGLNASRTFNMASETVFGTGYDYNLNTGVFTITGTDGLNGKTWSSNYKDLIGTYTCLNNTNTCSTLYYLGYYYNDSTASVASYTIGNIDSYQYLGKSAFNAYGYENNYYVSLSGLGYMYNKTYVANVSNSGGTYANMDSRTYANSVTWDDANNTYILDPDTSVTLSIPDATHHYTCDADCSKVRFYFYHNGSVYKYVLLEDGDIDPEYVMINSKTQGETTDANINVRSSAIKGYIDNWYKKNILGTQSESLIDITAVYCNYRYNNLYSSGWNKDYALSNGVPTIRFLGFSSFKGIYKNLACYNKTDRFTAETSNDKAKLTYPIGLITRPEASLMDEYARTESNYWSLSSESFGDASGSVYHILSSTYTGGYISSGSIIPHSSGVRPVITLKPNVKISDGDGTNSNPYIVGPLVIRSN